VAVDLHVIRAETPRGEAPRYARAVDRPGTDPPPEGDLIAAGEAALLRGEYEAAFDLLTEAASAEHAAADLVRLAPLYASAARAVDRPEAAIDWIEGQVVHALGDRAALLRARISVLRELDPARVLDLAPEAVGVAEAAGDLEAVASVLAHATWSAYRRGDVRRARELAEDAARRELVSPTAQYDCARSQAFAATAAGELEAALNAITRARAIARELGHTHAVAVESNLLAEAYLELGYPHEAQACAEAAEEIARARRHDPLARAASVLVAVATAEAGDLDAALARLGEPATTPPEPSGDVPAGRRSGRSGGGIGSRMARIDTAAIHAYWLLERGAAGDARRADEIAASGLVLAEAAGVESRYTPLCASLARAKARLGDEAGARAQVERARRVSDRCEPGAQSVLALAAAEVLAASDPQRKVVLAGARARILRRAARREDPHAFCVHVRLNRRLLELSGGVPSDLPRAP
jgi:tetratricopeptide (TPR) repeat protein